MNEPWFDPNMYSWMPGTFLGVFAGLWGALAGTLASQGKARGLVMGLWAVLMTASAVLLVAGIIAVTQGQPYGVWYGLLLAGGIGVFVLGPLYFTIRMRYRQAEAQRLEAKDL